MKIGIDFMGGDNFQEIGPAVNQFLKQSENKIVVFTTKENENNQQLKLRDNLEIIYCENSVNMKDEPAWVVRNKKESTMVVGARYLKEKKIDAFISAGNTGALIAVGVFVVKRMSGISKPALPGLLPRLNSNTPLMILDLGANVEPTVDNLIEYASLAQIYMKTFYEIENPSVKLMNIGAEPSKGDVFHKEVYNALEKNEEINFHGNIEPSLLLDADCDVMVMDGWTGNIMLKTLEGTVSFLKYNLKKIYLKNFMSKISALIIKKDFNNFQKQLDYKELGATPVLGVNELLLKCHGTSDQKAFYNAFKKAEILYDLKLIETLKKNIIK